MSESPKIDQAALLGVGLAAVVSISASEGSWELLETMIGLVLLLVVGCFYDGSAARSRQDWFLLKYAVSGVLSLIWCLVAAFFIQLFCEKLLGWNEKTIDDWLHVVLSGFVLLVFAVHVVVLTRRTSNGTLVKIKELDARLERRL